MSKLKRKLLSLLMTAAMITTLFAGMTISASATTFSGKWSSYYDTTWYDSSATSLTISDAADLAAFAHQVNAGTTFSGVTITLGDNIDLAGHYWTPIGGMCAVNSSYVPSGNYYFAGVFDGNQKTIDNMNITVALSDTGASSWGLFGLVKGGVIGNLTVKGSMSIAGSREDIGGIVGYTDNSLYNCKSEVTVNAPNCSNVGGLAGCVENKTTSNVNVKYCSNISKVDGGSRLGGLIGATYTGSSNHIYIESCYNSGDVENHASAKKNYTGGLIGYCCGNITDCYNQGDITMSSSSATCYAAGIAGILVHYNTPASSMENVYSTAEFTNFNTSYARFLWASADRSSSVTITNAFYQLHSDNSTMSQPSTSTWGTVTNLGTATIGSLTSSDLGSSFNYPENEWPTLKGVSYIDLSTGGSSVTDTDVDTMIFLDTSAGSNGTGTKESPCNSLSTAMGKLSTTRNVIYILNGLTFNSNASITSSVTNATIKRSCEYQGDMITVTGGTLTLGNIILDGNRSNVSEGSGSIVKVNGSSAKVETGSETYLQNNYFNAGGGAVNLASGEFDMTGGYIRNCGSIYGGAAYISGGTFDLSAGTIGGSGYANTAINGGALYIIGTGEATMSNGTISYNTAHRGGAVFLRSTSFTMNGGSITDNGASVAGAGVYVIPGATFEYAGSGIASSQVVYLNNTSGSSDAYITLTGTPSLNLKVQCAHPTVGSTKVATALTNISSSLEYVGNAYGFSGVEDSDSGDWNIFLAVYSS